MGHPEHFLLVMVAAALAPVLAFAGLRWCRIPVMIFEIALGVLLGPDVLGWVDSDAVLDTLSELGLAMLIFLAGYELDFGAVGRATMHRAVWSWLIALGAGIGLAAALSGGDVDRALIVGTALTSTALGSVLPILRDSGRLTGRFGTVMLAFGAVGEFGPIVAMALLLSGRQPLTSAVVLAVFAVITVVAVWWASRPRPSWFSTVVEATLHTSGQFAVRLVMLLLAAMLGLSAALGLDVLLGAFSAGILVRLILSGAAAETSREVMGKVEAMGFGFLVPLFFIVTGVEFDLDALLEGGTALLYVPVYLLLFLAVRGLPVYALAPRDLPRRDRTALTFFAATCLPLVVAITTIGLDEGAIASDQAAALVGAAMLSVLIYPLVALRAGRAPAGSGGGGEDRARR
ncbi:cation:proton antiporter [Streptomyces sp. C10-9-1]|uniref:cation:proton antiporter n=1 Tax=Streptomyces sp. C10-9-1 TaxID=1859285 RepID=UPI002112E4F3|nr:cation:proton antiporter [Streptomyces sp. C10-9-1]MCQ6552053.1 cation:proton antiporter [Streptomyces sp. C10-9-1]